jgi:hypothetical protein
MERIIVITLSAKKEYIIPYQDEKDKDFNFSMSFKFPYSEDTPMNKGEDAIDYIVRIAKNSIIKTEGIIDSDTGKEIELNDNTRKVLHDLIKTIPEYVLKIAIAYIGPKGKNLLTGVTPSLTMGGQQTNVDHASIPIVNEVVAS